MFGHGDRALADVGTYDRTEPADADALFRYHLGEHLDERVDIGGGGVHDSDALDLSCGAGLGD